ncbi:MAG: hypothetical protein BYD32DRAFT_430169 [Podila humilis]|nr:MAG: hypothetical protein BYD32DRAFT_430169 [Podila humilis]
MASNSVAAAAWSGTQTLYVQYRGPNDKFGTLLAINTTPTAPSPSPSFAPAPSASPIGNPAIPGGSSRTSLLYEVQAVSSPNIGGLGTPVSLSMVSISSLATPGSRDLLLAYNQPIGIASPALPVLLRYTPSSSSDQAWATSSFNLTSPTGTAAMWFAPGWITSSGDGSALYQLASSVKQQTLQKLDTQGTSLGAELQINLDALQMIPQLIPLNDAGARFDNVIVGACPVLNGAICLVFTKDTAVSSVQMTGGGSGSLTDACYTAANGFVVKIMTDGIYTFSYDALPAGIQTIAPWSTLQPPSGRPRIRTPLLACTSLGSALYAIAQGTATVPSLYRMNVAPVSGVEWDTIQLFPSNSDNGGLWMPPASSKDHGGLSKGALVGIIVAVVGVLGILAYAFWRRKNPKKGMGQGEKINQQRHLGTVPTVYSPVHTDNTPRSLSSPIYVPAQAPLPEQPVIYGQPHPGMHRENSEYSSMHSQSRPWSREGVSAPYANASYSPNIHQEHIPMIATSLGAAPTYNSYVVPVPPSPMSLSPSIIGDKQELSSDEQHFDIRSPSAASFHGQLQQQPVLVSGSLAVPNADTLQLNPEGVARNGKKPRIQTMMSPALANAQLILQASQHRPHQQQQQQQQQQPPPQAGPSNQPHNYYAQ